MNPAATPTPPAPAGVVHYDGECGLCRAWVARWAPRLAARGYAFQPMQAEASRQALGLAPGELAAEMKLILPDGRSLGGIHALAALYRNFLWGWPLWAASRTPGLRQLAEAGYRIMARRRHRLAAALGLPAVCPANPSNPKSARHEDAANCRG